MVSKQFYQDIDMVNIGQLIGARHQNVNNADMIAMVTLLGSNNKGLVVWNTDQNKEFVWDGTSFIPHETIQNASTTQAGVVQLNDNINSTSTTQAATANAVKKAYDIGNNKLPLTGGTLTGVLNGTSAVFSSSVQVGNGIHSASAVSFLNGGAAQNINTGGVLASNAYADATKVPTNGIYSKGKVHTATAVEIGSSVDGAKDTDYVRAVIHPPTHTGGDWEHTVRDDATYAYYKLGYGTSGYLQLRSDGVLIASGGFSGNAATATKLATARTINGVSFDGSSNITITAANPTTLTRGAGLTGANYDGASATTWAVAYGTAAGTACQGNDSRLSDARTPLAHSHGVADVTGLQGILDSKYSSGNTNIGTGASNYAAGNHGHAFDALTSVPETATRWPTAIEAGTAPIAGNSTAQNGYLNLIASNYALGKCLYRDIDFSTGSNSVMLYNNSGGSGVVHTRQADASAPNSSKQVIKISHNPALAISPGFGGFITDMSSAANKIFVQVFVAKLPVGRYFVTAENSMGTNSKTYWATSNNGTGKWERYIRITMCGDSGSFGGGGHTYVMGGSATAFDTYLAECTVYDLTSVALPYNKYNKPSPAEIGAQPAGSYAPSNHTHDYAPLTGAGTSGSWPISVTGSSASTTGNAATATKLQTPRAINGVSFDGTANITVADSTKLPLAGGTITGSLNVSDTITVTNVGEQVGAFKKLIQGHTTTDGGYIAVGNHGSDRGYVEIGTIDDPDAAIYARKRNSANTVLDEAVILGPDGNTSFPRSVNARTLGVNSIDGSGVGLSLYGGASNSMPEYGIAFAHTSNYGTHGGVVGDWATYFTMSGATNRGWIFKSGNGAGGNVASISASGEITGNQFKLTAIGDANYIANGNGDAASYSSHNMVIRSWWGIGFRDNQDVCRTVLDTRTGNFSTQGTIAAASVVASGSVQVGGAIQSTAAVSFLNGGSAQTINTGGVLASYSYADAYKVPPQGIYSKGEIVTETGRISAPSSAYHYIDLGRDGADRQIFGSYGAVYYFRNTINDADVVTINNGSISCVGSITAAGNVTAYSDERIKEDVTVIENALTKVEQLNGVTFKRKDTLDRQTGLLAQEVEAVLPEAVTHQEASEEIKAITGDEEVLAVNYGALTGLLVESIKELSDKLKAQQELIDKQAKLIENLLNKVSHT